MSDMQLLFQICCIYIHIFIIWDRLAQPYGLSIIQKITCFVLLLGIGMPVWVHVSKIVLRWLGLL